MPDTIINGIRIVKGGIKQRSPQIIPLHYPSERVDYKTTTVKATLDSLKTVAFSGSYNDLSDKPSIPATQVNADWNATSGVAKILNKPTIPTVNNATLTIQKNGTTVKTFTANASSNVTCNITVPTTFGDLTGTVAIANGGTGATTRLNALKNLTNEDVGTNATYFLTITNSWGKGGYTSVANAKTVLGLGSLAYKNSLSKSDVGLGNVDNTADANKNVNYAASAGAVAWNNVTGKPSSFTPASHTHPWTDVTGKPSTFTPSSHTHPWTDLTSTPTSFPPSSHTHPWSQITSKPTYYEFTDGLSVKGNLMIYHPTASVTGCNISESDNGTFKLRATSWLNLETANQVQCRNFSDTDWVPCAASSYPGPGSSRRYKENIKPITEEEVNKILDIDVITFDYKANMGFGDDEARINKRGVIAEDVEPIIPSAVVYCNDEEGNKIVNSVDYMKFVPYLIKMVQMLKKEIDDLKAVGHNS